MLDEAEKKQPEMKRAEHITFSEGDGLNLPCEDETFDAATISFGLRNMADRHRCLSELSRVLRPGGHLWVLEFSQPRQWMRPFYYFYLRNILPFIASVVTGDKSAYDYLCGSIEQFPTHQGIAQEMKVAGFEVVEIQRLTGGRDRTKTLSLDSLSPRLRASYPEQSPNPSRLPSTVSLSDQNLAHRSRCSGSRPLELARLNHLEGVSFWRLLHVALLERKTTISRESLKENRR